MISKEGVQPYPQKIKALTDMPVPNNKTDLQAFLGIINYLGKFSQGTADVCDPLYKLMSSKVIWTWKASFLALFNKAKLLIKSDMCMKFYDDTKLLYLETDALGVGLSAALLQISKGTTCQKDIGPNNTILCPFMFANKSLTCAEHKYSNIEREGPRHPAWAQKISSLLFCQGVHIITDHKPLVAIFKKDVATLLQCRQHILLKMYQYRVQILYKPGPEISIAD